MKRVQLAAISLSTVCLIACSPASTPDTFPGQPVTQRNLIFKQMLRSFEPLGLMVRGKTAFDANEAIQQADALKRLGPLPWSHFPAGSDYAPTKAKAAIWEKPEEFKRAQVDFVEAVDALASAARTRNEEALRAAHETVYQACSSCHKAFRR